MWGLLVLTCVQSHCIGHLIPEQFNDNYCDCMNEEIHDEPHTNACNLGKFQCHTTSHQIPFPYVMDGLWDCCDGSDEGYLNVSRCQQEEIQRQQTQLLLIELHTQGAKAKLSMLPPSTWYQDMKHRGRHAQEQLHELVPIFNQKKKTLQQQRPTKAEMERMVQLHQQILHYNYIEYRSIQFMKMEFDPDEAFVGLIGLCFQIEVNEKQLKGGSSNMIPRTYSIEFCPFHNITQQEPLHHEWRLAQEQAQLGDKLKASEPTERYVEKDIVLGKWKAWNYSRNAYPLWGIRMEFGKGDPCGNGDSRTAIVDMHCGVENQLIAAEEYEYCKYFLEFKTPAACHDDLEEVLSQRSTHDEL